MTINSKEQATQTREHRLRTVINYIKSHDDGSGVVLKRKEVLEIVKISEGDSAKALFRELNNCKDITIEKNNNVNTYYYIGEKEEKSKMSQTECKLVLSNVIQTGTNSFLTSIDGETLQKLWKDGTISYNADTQRGEKEVINRQGEKEMQPVYSKLNVKKITEMIISGKYHEDTIVLNVLKTGEEEIDYDNGTLYIAKGEINILDGQHRLHSLDLVKERLEEAGEQGNLKNIVFPLQIKNLNVEDAQDAFYQFSQGLKISTTRSEYFNNRDFENVIAKKLMNHSDLINKVEIIGNSISKNNTKNIVTFGTLVSAIRENFKGKMDEKGKLSSASLIDTGDKAEKVGNYLCEFVNELFKVIPEILDYEMRSESKKTSLITENFAFYGYFGVANYLMDKEDWKELLPKLLEVNFNKDMKPWCGKVTRRGKGGYIITNNSDSRSYFSKRLVKEFCGKINGVAADQEDETA